MTQQTPVLSSNGRAQEKKRQAFKKLAVRRTNTLLERIRILGNLANRRAYDYTDDEIRKMFGAIEADLRRVKASFQIAARCEFRLD